MSVNYPLYQNLNTFMIPKIGKLVIRQKNSTKIALRNISATKTETTYD